MPFMLLVWVFSKKHSLFVLVIILFHQKGNNSLFVCLNGGFMMDVKRTQMCQCPKVKQIVKLLNKHNNKPLQDLKSTGEGVCLTSSGKPLQIFTYNRKRSNSFEVKSHLWNHLKHLLTSELGSTYSCSCLERERR